MYKQQFVAVVQKKNRLQRQAVTTVNAMVQETARNSQYIKKYKKNRCQCHTIRNGPNVKSDRPPWQAYSEIIVVLYSELLGITVYNIQCIQCTYHEFTPKQFRVFKHSSSKGMAGMPWGPVRELVERVPSTSNELDSRRTMCLTTE